ncbi:alpha/beta fold hydrolase [Actinoallomurus rhizosphaericola]|uniref:alpha/beta fold hydrolase n=1 Tax=Actinoallomurus rhizosphaericola TaxID=2952536 RepID=UPI0020925C02|nr:alpha/beta fold hydrolase [Actinoallomurus rhizosphaericola]MCO5997627.1 alpha/beta hydrolase [Actinoallomurus rhizosphaericola]
MKRTIKTSAVIALACAAAGIGLAGCKADATAAGSPLAAHRTDDPFTGTKKIQVNGKAVNVSCSGTLSRHKPVIVLLPGLGDGLDKMAALQKTLSKDDRVCSYDRLGEGASDKPDGPQSFASTGKILTGVLDHVAGHHPVVLAGHSLGGMIVGRYAPDHRDKVKGVVLMDATTPNSVADITRDIPANATGQAAQLREQTLQVDQGNNPENLVITDTKVRSAGNIPVQVIKHGKPYLAAFPQYGPRMEQDWTAGQHKWLALSHRSKFSIAAKSEHYIYLDQPEVAVQAIERVAAQAAR